MIELSDNYFAKTTTLKSRTKEGLEIELNMAF